MSATIAPSRPSARVQLAAVFRKEVRQTVRDRRIMFMLVAAPLIQTVVLGFAVDFDVDRVPTLVVDRDGSAESREHARRLLAVRLHERAVRRVFRERGSPAGRAGLRPPVPPGHRQLP